MISLICIFSYMLNISHVILDEIHERDILSDFLMIILRDIIPHRSVFQTYSHFFNAVHPAYRQHILYLVSNYFF